MVPFQQRKDIQNYTAKTNDRNVLWIYITTIKRMLIFYSKNLWKLNYIIFSKMNLLVNFIDKEFLLYLWFPSLFYFLRIKKNMPGLYHFSNKRRIIYLNCLYICIYIYLPRSFVVSFWKIFKYAHNFYLRNHTYIRKKGKLKSIEI